VSGDRFETAFFNSKEKRNREFRVTSYKFTLKNL